MPFSDDIIGHTAIKYALVVATASLLALGQIIIAKFSRSLMIEAGVWPMFLSALQNKFFYLMFAVNGVASIGYIILTRKFPLQEIFVLNLITMAVVVALASEFFLGEPLTLRRVCGYGFAVLAVTLLAKF